MAEDTHAESSTTLGSPRTASPTKSMSPVKSPRVETKEDAPAPKRARITQEERARSKRMFGNLLGTLRRFQDEDKTKRSSEAAKRREETSKRIAAKLASEANLQNDLVETERELRALKLATENAAYVLEHREVALTARHASLRVSARYLHTSAPDLDPVFDSKSVLYPSAPVPLARGPVKGSSNAAAAPPLFYLPKVLLSHQQDALRARQEEIGKTIENETELLRADQDAQAENAANSADRIADLTAKLQRLKEQAAAAARGGRNTVGIRSVSDNGESSGRRASNGAREGDYDMESRHEDDDGMEVEY